MKATPTISKKTVGIIVIMIFTTGSLLSLSYWYSWAGIIPAAASIGGMVVWMGLWIEKEADDDAKKEEHLSEFIRIKAKLGWRTLMIGITIEIVTGSGLATFDIVNGAQNDPLNQPVSTISAFAQINVAGTNLFDTTTAHIGNQNRGFVSLMGLNLSGIQPTNGTRSELGFETLVSMDFFPMLSAASVPTNCLYIMHFESEFGPTTAIKTAKEIDRVNFLRIAPLFLKTNSEILGGKVSLVINSSVKREFRIVPQNDFNNSQNPFMGVVVIATNSGPTEIVSHPIK